MSPDKRRFPLSIILRSPDRQIVVNETGTVWQGVREKELRAMDPYVFVDPDAATYFPTHELVRNRVTNAEQVFEALRSMVTFMPHRKQGSIHLPEFVDLDKIVVPHVVKTHGKKRRTGPETPQIGLDHVLHYTRQLQRHGMDLNPGFDPMRVDFVNGKYYVTNGIYRAAALRALRIPFAPMYVRGAHH